MNAYFLQTTVHFRPDRYLTIYSIHWKKIEFYFSLRHNLHFFLKTRRINHLAHVPTKRNAAGSLPSSKPLNLSQIEPYKFTKHDQLNIAKKYGFSIMNQYQLSEDRAHNLCDLKIGKIQSSFFSVGDSLE